MSGFTSAEATILQSLIEVQKQLGEINHKIGLLDALESLPEEVSDLREFVQSMTTSKDYYSTREVAETMNVTQHTVQVRWCAEGRIDCDKDPATGQWRIPGDEFERLRRGGKPSAA